MSQSAHQSDSPARPVAVRMTEGLRACVQWLTSLLAPSKQGRPAMDVPTDLPRPVTNYPEFRATIRRAAAEGDVALVEKLLDRTSKNSTHRRAALCFAAAANQLPVTRLVLWQYLPAGIDDLGRAAKEEAVLAASKAAVAAASLTMVVELIRHCQDQRSLDALAATAALHQRMDVLHVLIERIPDTSNALLAATQHGTLEMVDLLLPRADTAARNGEALRLAATRGHVAIVARLLALTPNLEDVLLNGADKIKPEAYALIRAHLDQQALSGSETAMTTSGASRL